MRAGVGALSLRPAFSYAILASANLASQCADHEARVEYRGVLLLREIGRCALPPSPSFRAG